MKERYRFWGFEKVLGPILPPHLGTINSIFGSREVKASAGDEGFETVRAIQTREYPFDDKPFLGWEVLRDYTPDEIASAEIFHVYTRILPACPPVPSTDEPHYDYSTGCSHCGAGRTQISNLQFDTRSLPRKRHLVKARDGEILVSEAFVDCIRSAGFTGVSFRLVDHLRPYSGTKTNWDRLQTEHDKRIDERRLRGKPPPKWFQLQATGPRVPAVPPTRFGASPFDAETDAGRICPLGHASGSRLLTELYVARNSWSGEDIAATSNLVGAGRVFVPQPLLLFSPRLRKAILDKGLGSGLAFDVVYLR